MTTGKLSEHYKKILDEEGVPNGPDGTGAGEAPTQPATDRAVQTDAQDAPTSPDTLEGGAGNVHQAQLGSPTLGNEAGVGGRGGDLRVLPPTPTVTVGVMAPHKLEQMMGLYREQQAVIDRFMPDAIMVINPGKKSEQKFRKKAYWRAVAIAFNLRVECVRSERISVGDDWGFEVVYRAIRPNGTYAEGDGGCMASEKVVYKWKNVDGRNVKTDEVDELKSKQNATIHNIRSHAHTRAFNRAVSNCVGFGEVSAEEVTQ